MNQEVYFGRYAHSLRPKAVNTKHSHIVTVFLLSSIPYLRPVEHILNRQHGDYCQHFLTASQVYRHDQHLTQHGLQREFCHLQKNCFRVPWKASKNLEFPQWNRKKLFFYAFSSKQCVLPRIIIFNVKLFVYIHTLTRISQHLQEIILDIHKNNLMNKQK